MEAKEMLTNTLDEIISKMEEGAFDKCTDRLLFLHRSRENETHALTFSVISSKEEVDQWHEVLNKIKDDWEQTYIDL